MNRHQDRSGAGFVTLNRHQDRYGAGFVTWTKRQGRCRGQGRGRGRVTEARDAAVIGPSDVARAGSGPETSLDPGPKTY